MKTPSLRACPKCGASLPATAAEALCPRCLFAQLSALENDVLSDASEVDGLSVQVPQAEPQISREFGDYELQEELGRGGMGVVYRARQVSLNRLVALKVIKLGMDTQAVITRFEAERQALALMDHPGIARVIDAGATEAGRPYFVMELVAGVRITDYCDQHQLATRDRLELFIKVCQAVQHAHQKGVIHRDLKPSNILVAVQDGVPVPKVIDFGIAKATAGRLTDQTLFTAFDQFIGTPSYLSPEQAEPGAVDIDTRSDIYSLGVLLYELLTGQLPFDPNALVAAGLAEVRRRIREEKPPRPSTKVSSLAEETLTTVAQRRQTEAPKLARLLKGDLDWIVMKCLEKERSRRYETANGLASDLRRHLRREPVLARPPSRFYEFQTSIRRHWVGFSAAAAIVVVLVMGVVMTSIELARARRAEREQSRERERAERTIRLRELQRAEDLLRRDQASEALALLARLLRKDPSNSVAASRVISVLNQRTFPAPLCPSLRHDEKVYDARFSADDTKVVTASGDRTARVWDARTGQPLTPPLRHAAAVQCAAFSRDGTRVITGSADKTARIWDAGTGQAIGPPLVHDAGVGDVEINSTGEVLATVAGNKAWLWEAKTGRARAGPLQHTDAIRSVDFSRDGRWLLTGSKDNTARVWDAANGNPGLVLSHTHWVQYAEFSPNGQLIVVAGYDGHVRVSEFPGGAQVANLSHTDVAEHAAFSPDSEMVATVSRDRTLRLWNARGGEPLGVPMVHLTSVMQVRFSPDGERLLTVCADNTAWLWNVRTGQRATEPLRHNLAVRVAAFSSDGTRVVTAADDQMAVVWDVRPRGSQWETWFPKAGAWARFSGDSQQLLTWSSENAARVWDARTSRPISPLLRHRSEVVCADWNPDGKRVATGSFDGLAAVWHTQSGDLVFKPIRHSSVVNNLCFSPEGDRLATATRDGNARVWRAHDGLPLTETMNHHGSRINVIRFSPDGRLLATGGHDQAAHIWDSVNGHERVPPLKHGNIVLSICFSPDSRRVVTASTDTTARVWDADTGQPITPPLKHTSFELLAGFSPDGSRVITAAGDATARLWDATTGRPTGEPLRHDGGVLAACFSPNGAFIATVSRDQTARLWDSRSGLPLTEPLLQGAVATSVAFSPDGRQFVSAGRSLDVVVRGVPHVQAPVPAWLPALAEAVAGNRLNPQGQQEFVAPDEFFAVKRAVLAADTNDDYLEFARHYLTNATQAVARLVEPAKAPGQLRVVKKPSPPHNSGTLQVLFSHAASLAGSNDLAGAVSACTRVIDGGAGDVAAWDIRTRALFLRRRLWMQLGRFDEAETDSRRLESIPVRPAETPELLIDLSPFYTAALDEDWHGAQWQGNNLAQLPHGHVTFDKVPYDVRGIIQLGSPDLDRSTPEFPKTMKSIPIGQACRRLHFLQALGWGNYVAVGTRVGAYRLHYADGEELLIPIIRGEDADEWQTSPGSVSTLARAKVVWQGLNDRGLNVRLFERAWDNPRPASEIATLDFISDDTAAAPFLVALTVEE